MSELRLRLEIQPCSVSDARAAVMRWHYSKRMPVGRLICHGVWEAQRFVGVIVYGRGASQHLGAAFGCTQFETCELVRVALAPGRTVPTSRALGISLRLLRFGNPDLKLVISFADPAQGHAGILYQATNWLYTGLTSSSPQYLWRGRWCHNREMTSGAFGKGGRVANISDLPMRMTEPKHRYVYPLLEATRASIDCQPYPKAYTPERAESIVAMQPAPSGTRAARFRPQRSKQPRRGRGK